MDQLRSKKKAVVWCSVIETSPVLDTQLIYRLLKIGLNEGIIVKNTI
jgi:hypothetical protein